MCIVELSYKTFIWSKENEMYNYVLSRKWVTTKPPTLPVMRLLGLFLRSVIWRVVPENIHATS